MSALAKEGYVLVNLIIQVKTNGGLCVCVRLCVRENGNETHVNYRQQHFGQLSSGVQRNGNGGKRTTGHLLTLSHQLL